MSTFDFKLPDIGEGVMEGEIVQWLVAVGDQVQADQPIAEVMTDKATVTITTPKAGTITKLGAGEGAIVPVHSTLVLLDLGGAAASTEPQAQEVSAPSSSSGKSNCMAGCCLPSLATALSTATVETARRGAAQRT